VHPPRAALPYLSGAATRRLPPKIRGKALAGPQPAAIPSLPRASSTPPSRRPAPAIGSLAAAIHPSLGPAFVCRVLAGRAARASQQQFLVVAFQTDRSPCWLAAEHLFPLTPQSAFPLGDDAAFRAAMVDVSVDWLLEKVFSAAQFLIINGADVLTTKGRRQQVMFQCVSYAALLVFCYVAGEWDIPVAKAKVILDTIVRANGIRFMSTMEIMRRAEVAITRLLGLEEGERT
jgi:hypothetical protein